jgi:ABC-type glutathione transport system ATPase component
LSTITEADQIIVLHAGQVAEKGTHEELLEKKGRYAQMWERQIRAERAAQHARAANLKAQRLMRKANIPGDQDGDGRSDGYNSMSSSAVLPGGRDGQDKSASQTADEHNTCSSASSDAGSIHNERR